MSNGQEKKWVDEIVPVKDFKHFTIDGKRVWDPRKEEKFTEPEDSASLIVAHHETAIENDREGSPARSEISHASYIDSAPSDIVTYPSGVDGKALLINVANPNLYGWLPNNPSMDYKVDLLPGSSSKVILSESLGIVKYVN